MLRMASDMLVRAFDLVNVIKEPTSQPAPPIRSHERKEKNRESSDRLVGRFSSGANAGFLEKRLR
jgi:hypothetical protein